MTDAGGLLLATLSPAQNDHDDAASLVTRACSGTPPGSCQTMPDGTSMELRTPPEPEAQPEWPSTESAQQTWPMRPGGGPVPVTSKLQWANLPDATQADKRKTKTHAPTVHRGLTGSLRPLSSLVASKSSESSQLESGPCARPSSSPDSPICGTRRTASVTVAHLKIATMELTIEPYRRVVAGCASS